MAIISQETWDNMSKKEKENIISYYQEYSRLCEEGIDEFDRNDNYSRKSELEYLFGKHNIKSQIKVTDDSSLLDLKVNENSTKRDIIMSLADGAAWEKEFGQANCNNNKRVMKTNHKTFKPFDKVLVRDIDDGIWKPSFYQFFNEETGQHAVMSIDYWLDDFEILPYVGNEHLVGTTDETDEEVKLEEGEWIAVFNNFTEFYGGPLLRKFLKQDNSFSVYGAYASEINFEYAVKLSDFNTNDMEETKKHILCVKNGKIVKYKE